MNRFAKPVKQILERYNELPPEAQKQVQDDILYQGMMQAAAEVAKTDTVFFGDLYAEVLERQKFFNKFEGFSSGLKYFDDALMGFRPGEVIIIAGPSNYGKTMVALNLAASTAVTAKKVVLIISMEMLAVSIASRLYNMTPEHDTLMDHIIIQTELDVNTEHIAAMIDRHRPELVMIDHLQFLANQEHGSEYERINAAIKKIKRLAVVKKIPIVVISHVAKTRSGSSGQATAADLKGSSAIEQDSDIGFMVNRPKDQITGNTIIMTLFKHREKQSKIMHQDQYLQLDGIRIAFHGHYSADPPPSTPDWLFDKS